VMGRLFCGVLGYVDGLGLLLNVVFRCTGWGVRGVFCGGKCVTCLLALRCLVAGLFSVGFVYDLAVLLVGVGVGLMCSFGVVVYNSWVLCECLALDVYALGRFLSWSWVACVV